MRRTCSKNQEEQETARIGPGRCEDSWAGSPWGERGEDPKTPMFSATLSSILVPAETWAWIGRENGGLGRGSGASARTGGFLGGHREASRWEKENLKSLDHQDWES